jgi:hypothetical protein
MLCCLCILDPTFLLTAGVPLRTLALTRLQWLSYRPCLAHEPTPRAPHVLHCSNPFMCAFSHSLAFSPTQIFG